MKPDNLHILYNLRSDFPAEANIHPDISADWDIPETIQLLHQGLENIGYGVTDMPYKERTPNDIHGFDGIVFNICEMYGGSFREALIPSLCELYNLKYVFSGPDVMHKTLDKNLCNYLVRQTGADVPDWLYFSDLAELGLTHRLHDFPYIVKLCHEGSGIGISDRSVVHDHRELLLTATGVMETFRQPVIIQKYIQGTEATIGIAGDPADPAVFKLIEVELLNSQVYGITEKENSDTRVRYVPFDHKSIEENISNMSRTIYRALGCRDAARIDFRLEKHTMKPYFIEINPLPHLHPVIGDFCRSAKAAGYSYEAMLSLIMGSAQKRFRN